MKEGTTSGGLNSPSTDAPNNSAKLYFGAMFALVGGIAALGLYARIWEGMQPEETINSAKVLSIEPYNRSNDLHWSSRGNRLRIVGGDRVIDFPRSRWDSSVQVGDTIDLVVRRSFPLFGDELDGREINDYK